MDQHFRLRQHRRELVMIGDDDLQSECRRLGDFLDGTDAAINADDPLHAVVREFPKRLAVQTVAVDDAVRHMEFDFRVQDRQQSHQDRGAGGAVHVVVAVDADALIRADGGKQFLGGFGYAGHESRGVQAGHRRPQEFPGGRRRTQTAVHQQLGDDRRDRRLARQIASGFRILSGDLPTLANGGQGFVSEG